MKISRRSAISLTAGGLIHVAASPESALGQQYESRELFVRAAAERGHTDLGWLDSYHSFSFGNYQDQRHMGFRALRVINDDRIAAGRGFPTHPHRNMEIISYVLDGALQHRDSTGRGAVITPDDIQMMSAGRGITHSEFNPSERGTTHLLQVWIQPAMRGGIPRYRDNKVTPDRKRDRWAKIVGPDGTGAAVTVGQDALIFATNLSPGKTLDYTVERGRHAWLQVARGNLSVNGVVLNRGDAIATSRSTQLHLRATEQADVLLFDLG
jgi:redox-sensitive bicupin YhaK (pirin superfamily)